MIILINYADKNYKKAQHWNTISGLKIAKFDKCFSFGPEDIEEQYKQKHREIFQFMRGNGLWLWKPYFINRVLNESQEGDFIFYCDSGAVFIHDIRQIISSMKENEHIWVSDCPLIESCFTKEICFELMDCNQPEIKDTNQIQATYILIKNSPRSKAFVEEWLHYCECIDLIRPDGDLAGLKNYIGRGFVAHREDQSILSLLCKKKGIKAHRDLSHRGKYPETFFSDKYVYNEPKHPLDTYKSIVFLHKLPNPNIINCTKILLIALYSKLRFPKKEKHTAQ